MSGPVSPYLHPTLIHTSIHNARALDQVNTLFFNKLRLLKINCLLNTSTKQSSLVKDELRRAPTVLVIFVPFEAIS